MTTRTRTMREVMNMNKMRNERKERKKKYSEKMIHD
jgi:hypothetical protein